MSSIGAAIGIAGALGAGATVASGALGASAASNAASTQANAAESVAQQQAQEAQNALNFQEKEWNTQQANLAPWLSAGKQGLAQLQGLLGTPGQGLLAPFTPPTLAQAEQYPGYQFGLQQSEGALQNSAAAQGSLESANTQEALSKFAQNYAQNDYSNVYNQAFNTFESNQLNQFNRLAALSGVGQQAGTTLGQQGQAAAQNTGNIMLTAGAQQGQDLQNAAAAMASGYIGGANAWSGALSGGSSNITQLLLLNSLLNPSSGASADVAGYNPNSWIGGPTYMPGGGPTVAPYPVTG